MTQIKLKAGFKCQLLMHLLMFFMLSVSSISIAYAQKNIPIKTFPETVYFFAKNPNNSEIYASTDNGILIIDATTLKLISKISLAGSPRGLDVSADGSKLYVATSALRQLAVIDIASRKILPPIYLTWMPYDVRVGNHDRAYATPGDYGYNDAFHGIMMINTITGKFIKEFSFPRLPLYYGSTLLQISPDKNSLYFAATYPTLIKINVATDTPAIVIYWSFRGLQSEDLFMTPSGDYIYYATGDNINRSDSLDRLRTADLTAQGTLSVGQYPHAVATSPDGNTAYVVQKSSGAIQIWNTNIQQKQCELNTQEDANKLFTDSKGLYLFAAFQNELRIYNSSCETKR